MKREIIPAARIAQAIYLLRGQKVMLDSDLAALCGVQTRALNQAVKRNADRFPEDFVFTLSRQEIGRVSQIVTSSSALKFSKQVHAFTEQGAAMLSSVLNSERVRVAHASRVWVSASRRNELSCRPVSRLTLQQSPQWRDAIANTRDACATQSP
jgi:hypothetical protein